MPEMPTLGAPPPSKSPVAAIAIAATVVGLFAGGLYWLKHRDGAPSAEPLAAEAEAAAPKDAGATLTEAAAPPTTPQPVGATPPEPSAAPGAAVAAAPTTPAPSPTPAAPAPPPAANGPKHLSAVINGPLEAAISQQAGSSVGPALTQVVNRTLVWWLKVPNDLLKNDELQVVYEERSGQEPLVHAVRYTSRKFAKTFEAYRYRAPGAEYGRFFQADQSELEERLVDGPLETYEQITSLLRDGRRHKGVDFKTPVGTPVMATFDGVVARKNWNFRGNGNSLEIEEAGGQGRTALFLHLSEVPKSVKPGDRVKKGQVIAQSGNTGHSFAPHLHYQLMQGGKVLDPFDSHKTRRASVPAEQRAGLEAEIARLRSLLPGTELAGR